MKTRVKITKIISITAISFLIAGCSTPPHRQILSGRNIDNYKEFSVSKDMLYDATLKVVCDREFIIEKEDKEGGFIMAKRYFKKGNRNIVLALQAKIIPEGETKSTIYLSALETTDRLYVADRTRFFLFIIPLPGGGGKEANTIKEGERIIDDDKFYRDFFQLIKKEIGI